MYFPQKSVSNLLEILKITATPFSPEQENPESMKKQIF